MLKKILKNKKGVTLVELTIVIALVAIITTMVGGFLTSFKGSSYLVLRSGNKVSEINSLQDAVRNWVLAHDTIFYNFDDDTITVESNGESKTAYRVTATVNSAYVSKLKGIENNLESDYPDGAIWFEDGKLQLNGESTMSFEMIRDVQFLMKSGYPNGVRQTYKTNADGEIVRGEDGRLQTKDTVAYNVLVCNVTMKDGTTQTLMFTIFSQTYRDRYSAGLVIDD